MGFNSGFKGLITSKYLFQISVWGGSLRQQVTNQGWANDLFYF